MTFDEFSRYMETVPCAGGRCHGVMLWSLCRWLKPASIVEVGTYQGYSALWLARGLHDNGHGVLTCIDDWSFAPNAMFALGFHLARAELEGAVNLSFGKSTEARWPLTVDLAYIDGDHSLAACAHDAKKAAELGAQCVVLHDTGPDGWWGPREFLDGGHLGPGWDKVEVAEEGGLAVLMKRPMFGPVAFTREKHPSGACRG